MHVYVWGQRAQDYLESALKDDRATGLDDVTYIQVGAGFVRPEKAGMLLVHSDDYPIMRYSADVNQELKKFLAYPFVMICEADVDDEPEVHAHLPLNLNSEMMISAWATHDWDYNLLAQKLCPRQKSYEWHLMPTKDQLIEFGETKRFELDAINWLSQELIEHAKQCISCRSVALSKAHTAFLLLKLLLEDDEVTVESGSFVIQLWGGDVVDDAVPIPGDKGKQVIH